METKEINQENIKALVKLGIDVNDIANVYLEITEKGKDISKDTYINNLTDMLKFFQTRNKGINDENSEAIYKEDVLNMVKKNRKLVSINIGKKVKPVCEKLDSYYFMNTGYTNKLIKNNPKIFNISNVDLETYSTVLSNFVIKVNESPINLFEYIIKNQSDFLENDVQKIYGRIMYLKNEKNSKIFTKQDLEQIKSNTFSISDEALKGKYKLPKYNGENVAEYKQKILSFISA